MWLVTVKLPRHPDHDPSNKQAGVCPLSLVIGRSHRSCGDTLGQHHTVLVESASTVRELREKFHITRVEEA